MADAPFFEVFFVVSSYWVYKLSFFGFFFYYVGYALVSEFLNSSLLPVGNLYLVGPGVPKLLKTALRLSLGMDPTSKRNFEYGVGVRDRNSKHELKRNSARKTNQKRH